MRKHRPGRKERLAKKLATVKRERDNDPSDSSPRVLGFRHSLTISQDSHELTSRSHYSGCAGAHSQGTGYGGKQAKLVTRKALNRSKGIKQRFDSQPIGTRVKPYCLANVTWHLIPSHTVPLKDKETGEVRLVKVPAKQVPRGLKR